MKIVVLNASPRKNWNTAQLLKETARGAESAGAEVECGGVIGPEGGRWRARHDHPARHLGNGADLELPVELRPLLARRIEDAEKAEAALHRGRG